MQLILYQIKNGFLIIRTSNQDYSFMPDFMNIEQNNAKEDMTL